MLKLGLFLQVVNVIAFLGVASVMKFFMHSDMPLWTVLATGAVAIAAQLVTQFILMPFYKWLNI